MGKEFEISLEAQVDATPEQVWETLATGPGISSWFVGRTDVAGEVVRTTFGDDWIPAGTVTARDELHRFAYGTPAAPDGRRIAYEYLIEGRDRATTIVRAVTSGFLPGDDWVDEYEAMGHGTALFFASLVEVLRFFPGRTGATTTTFGPGNEQWDTVRDAEAAEGVVYFTNPHTIGVRTGSGLRRRMLGLHGAIVTDIVTFS